MKRLLIICLCSFLTIVNATAGRPDDHVRYYTIYDRSDPTFAYLFLILVAIGVVVLLIAVAVQKIQKKVTTRKERKEPTHHTCPVCNGEGFLKKEQIYPSTCPYCKGHRKELTPKIKKLMEEIEKKKKEDFLYRKYYFGDMGLREELNKAPKCSHCHGTGVYFGCMHTKELEYDEKLVGYREIYYKVEKCHNCDGRGYTYW